MAGKLPTTPEKEPKHNRPEIPREPRKARRRGGTQAAPAVAVR